jgi:hypothetical protein
MNAPAFHNALRILLNLGEENLRLGGVIDENWGTPEASNRDQLDAFFTDPVRESIRMPDTNFQRLCDLIEARQPEEYKEAQS